MKRIFTTILMALGITGPFVTNLAAQSNQMVADVPFAFVAYNRTMPAGQYELSQLNAGGTTFELRNVGGKTILLQMANRYDGKPNKASLTFACYGNDRVLARITPPDSSTAYSLSRNAIEKNLHHTLGMASMVSIKLTAR